MITNEERKQVAARLREDADLYTFAEIFDFSWTDESDWRWRDVAAKIADYVEPEPERTCKPHGEWERTSQLQECRRVLCDCGHELGMDMRRGFPIKIGDLCELPNFCPNCGAKVVENLWE